MIYKVLIIEDEGGIRRRLASAIDWESLCCELCGQTDSGLSGLEHIVKHMPDIVISDIVMPNIDGLTLLRYVKERNYDIKFIFLTGYKEFDYAKEALRLGAHQLLTKPVDFDELRRTIMEVVLQLNERHVKALSQGAHVIKPPPLKESIEAMFKGRYVNESQLRFAADALNIQSKYAVACLRLIDFYEVSHYDEVFNALCEVAGQCLADPRLCWVPIKREYVGILLPDWAFGGSSMNALYAYAKDLHVRIASGFRQSFAMGISRICGDLMTIHDAFIEACVAAREIFYIGRDGVNPYRGEYDETALEGVHVDEFLDGLDAVAIDSPNVMARIHALFEGREPYPSPASLKTFLISAIFQFLYRSAPGDKRFIAALSDGGNTISRIVGALNATAMYVAFFESFDTIRSYQKLRKSGGKEDLVHAAICFVEENFTKDITLKDVADHVFISPAYLSNLIKLTTGENFIDILNRLRIGMATRLLREEGSKVYEVAEKAGFNDARYFSQTFKRITGQSPSEIQSR